jgi:hypothetical protein
MVFDCDKPEYALPGARYKRWPSATVALERSKERTFSVEPQKRPIGLPFSEDTPTEKPLRCFPVIGTTGDVVVYRRILRREPTAEVLAQLVPCEDA